MKNQTPFGIENLPISKHLTETEVTERNSHLTVALKELEKVIADQRKAMEELKINFDQLSFHIENLPLARIEWDKESHAQSWSKRAEEIFGWTASEFINGQKLGLNYVYEDDLPLVKSIFEDLTSGRVERNSVEIRYLTKDGRIIWCEWFNSVIRDDHGDVVTIMSLVQDTTKKKKEEEQKDFDQQEKEALINTTDDLIWSVSKDLKLIAANNAFLRRVEDLTGIIIKPGDDLMNKDFFSPDVLTYWDEVYTRAMSGISFKHEIFNPAQYNSVDSWGETSFNPIYQEGNLVAISCFSRDITERKLAEERIKQSEAELQLMNEKLRNLTAHLQNIQEHERTTIAREIHDALGQQLTALKMEVGWLNKKLPDEPKLKEKAQDILLLTGDILKTVKRIAMGLRPGILDDLGLIAALEWHGQEFEKHTGIKFEFHCDCPDFNPDKYLATHIFRISQEALTNVARHSQASKIEMTLQVTDQIVKLIIKDDGHGFDLEKGKNQNSLGLIGMNERALMLMGTLCIESEKTKGTVITLSIPITEENKNNS
ncbi:MAG: PAS domain S-box protein [Saprospiraceae bacterium]